MRPRLLDLFCKAGGAWTLPAGSAVTVESVQLPIKEFGQQVATATCTAPELSEWGFAVPVTALPALAGVPVYRYDAESGRSVPA